MSSRRLAEAPAEGQPAPTTVPAALLPERVPLVRNHLKITVMGNSTAIWVAPERADRGDGNYGEWLEALLPQRGLPVSLINLAAWNELLPKAVCRFGSAVRAGMPDVVILQYGIIEAFPAYVPVALHNYLRSWHVHAGFGRTFFRHQVRKLIWKRARSFQRRGAARFGPRTHHVGPARFASELKKLMYDIHLDQQALIVVCGVARPSASLRAAIPGIEHRVDLYNNLLRQACADATKGAACFIDLHAVLPDEPSYVPDGLHISPQGHRLVGLAIADRIEQWARDASGCVYQASGLT